MKYVVVGAGLMGLGVAWRLLEAGHDVTVLEKNTVGSGASGAAAGMLAPTAELKFEETELLHISQESLAMWKDLAAELEEKSGQDVDYRTEGTLVVGLDRDDSEALQRLFEYQTHLGLPVERLSGDALREREPSIHPTAHSAVFIPDDHQVDPRLVVSALAKIVAKLGGEIREGVEVTDVAPRSVKTAEDELSCDEVVICAGAWTRKLGSDAPYIRPVRGQMLSLRMKTPAICNHVVRAPDAYLVPKSDGRLVVGATMEEMGFDPNLTAGGLFELLRGAWETMPGIYDLDFIEAWTGFRPMSLDNMPVVRKGEDGIHYVTGHGRGGVLLLPWTLWKASQELVSG